MYRTNRSTSGGTSRFGRRFNSSRPRFGRRPARPVKKLDHRLFVNKVDTPTETAPAPIVHNHTHLGFSQFKIGELLRRNIKDHGYTKPTEIQQKAIPEILSGHDVIGMANTGTGKTAAFLITLINKACLDRSQRVLIVVPTRELATQIRDEYEIFAKGTGLRAVAIVGGVNIKQQTYALKNRPHFVIGTPGRLKDLTDRKELNLANFNNVVLDEVDKMVDIGFLHDIKYLISFLPKERQSLFFSATINDKAQEILKSFVRNPVTVSVIQKRTADGIHQDIIKMSGGKSKLDTLIDLLNQSGFDKVIIFGRTKWGIQRLANDLVRRGFKAVAIHGNKTQNQRQRALQLFKESGANILLATDVVSRGLDIDNVTHVINYDAPESYDDYVHRIGRTGRAGKKGIALTFVE